MEGQQTKFHILCEKLRYTAWKYYVYTNLTKWFSITSKHCTKESNTISLRKESKIIIK